MHSKTSLILNIFMYLMSVSLTQEKRITEIPTTNMQPCTNHPLQSSVTEDATEHLSNENNINPDILHNVHEQTSGKGSNTSQVVDETENVEECKCADISEDIENNKFCCDKDCEKVTSLITKKQFSENKERKNQSDFDINKKDEEKLCKDHEIITQNAGSENNLDTIKKNKGEVFSDVYELEQKGEVSSNVNELEQKGELQSENKSEQASFVEEDKESYKEKHLVKEFVHVKLVEEYPGIGEWRKRMLNVVMNRWLLEKQLIDEIDIDGRSVVDKMKTDGSLSGALKNLELIDKRFLKIIAANQLKENITMEDTNIEETSDGKNQWKELLVNILMQRRSSMNQMINMMTMNKMSEEAKTETCGSISKILTFIKNNDDDMMKQIAKDKNPILSEEH